MVRALLAGTKTQTRRIVKGLWKDKPLPVFCGGEGEENDPEAWGWEVEMAAPFQRGFQSLKAMPCPYGQPGDRLIVRENGWERPERTAKMMREGADTWAPFYFDADGISAADAEQFKEWGFKRRPSILMPWKFSRLTLEITSIRVERLQDISEADAKAEGITIAADAVFTSAVIRGKASPAQLEYFALWESIHGPGSWALNPWVWVVKFKRLASPL